MKFINYSMLRYFDICHNFAKEFHLPLPPQPPHSSTSLTTGFFRGLVSVSESLGQTTAVPGFRQNAVTYGSSCAECRQDSEPGSICRVRMTVGQTNLHAKYLEDKPAEWDELVVTCECEIQFWQSFTTQADEGSVVEWLEQWTMGPRPTAPFQECTTGSILTLSLPRVINVKFLLQPHQKYYITQGELGFS